jgi:hypothetical protein
MNLWIIISGILALFLSLAHAIYGEKYLIPSITHLHNCIAASVRICWHQGSLMFLGIGIVCILWGCNVFQLSGISQYFPVSIVVVYFSIFVGFIFLKYRSLLQERISPLLILVIMTILHFIGIACN